MLDETAKSYKKQISLSQSKISAYEALEVQFNQAQREIEDKKSQIEILNQENQYLTERNKRLTDNEGRAVARDERIKSLEEKLPEVLPPEEGVGQPSTEIEWLNKISRCCHEYGIDFPKRILFAFHTALKISDWSIITVLAGVSGTGKSELPRLYSMFGGFNYMSVPVQPNWDSQESMLGFFNSIDNRFDAQPLLRFLVQCSSAEMEYSMNIVLLDEMNLAYVEHYFADFLSKLEERRGVKRGKEPAIDIKLGAGMEPYPLKLTRNILWTGTMNQDETTKSLSDKVLDRGIVINFPRPKALISRKKMTNLLDFVEKEDIHRLNRKTWSKWLRREIVFKDKQLEEMNKYLKIIEDINDCLAFVGRAIGHRVWQSIEFYIANYPEVIAAMEVAQGELTEDLAKAMKTAFEDQLVQKVMPKLRGIDTHGKSLDNCLRKIKGILVDNGFSLEADFQRACDIGYGQFIWCSAEYIDDTDIAGIQVVNTADAEKQDETSTNNSKEDKKKR